MYKKMHRKILTRQKRKFVLIPVLIPVLGLLFLLGSCAKSQAGQQVSETRLLLDTYCSITIHGAADEQTLINILDRAFEMCLEYEKLFSITIEGSDVWRINHAGGEPVEVDAHTLEVIKTGLVFGELSYRMFDITIGRLSRLWDFGNSYTVPETSEIDEAQMTVDFGQMSIDGNIIQLKYSDTWIDLGAIAKGYIADRIAEYLTEQGVQGALIDLGGDIVAIGNRSDGSPWRIAVRNPFSSSDEYIGVLEVTGASVVSSGTYERGFEENGLWHHHILDPKTGWPVKTDVVSATVISDKAVNGEGLSTIAVLLYQWDVSVVFKQIPGFIGAVLVFDDGEVLTYGKVKFLR